MFGILESIAKVRAGAWCDLFVQMACCSSQEDAKTEETFDNER